MKLNAAVLTMVMGLVVFAAPLRAMDCDGDRHFNPQSIIHVVTNPIQVRYFHDHSTSQIEQMRNMKFHNRLLHNPGVTLEEHEFKMDYQIGGLEHPHSDGVCVWVDSVRISMWSSTKGFWQDTGQPLNGRFEKADPSRLKPIR